MDTIQQIFWDSWQRTQMKSVQELKRLYAQLVDYYNNNQKSYTEEYFKVTHPFAWTNTKMNEDVRILDITSGYVNALSILMSDGLEIKAENETDQKFWDNLIESSYTKLIAELQNIEKKMNLCGIAELRVFWNKEKQEIGFSTITPDNYSIIQDENDLRTYKEIGYTEEILDEYNTRMSRTYHSWTKDTYKRIDFETGKEIEIDNNRDNVNPYGFLPFITFRTGQDDGRYYVIPNESLLDAQLSVNVDKSAISYFKRHLSPTLVHKEKKGSVSKIKNANKQETVIGVGKINRLGENEDLNFLNPDYKIITERTQNLNATINEFYSMNGLEPVAVRSSNTGESGVRAKLSKDKMKQIQKQSLILFFPQVREVLDKARRIYNIETRSNISGDFEVMVPNPVVDANLRDSIDAQWFAIETDQVTVPDLIQEKNPYYSKKQSIDKYKDNVAFNNEYRNKSNNPTQFIPIVKDETDE